MTHCQLDVATRNLDVSKRTGLADTNTVKRTDDREWELVLIPRSSSKELDCELLKSVGRNRRRHLQFISLDGRPAVGRFEHHRGTEVRNFLQHTGLMRLNRSITGRGDDALVRRD